MRRTLVWLNLYSFEAVQRKRKNSLKTQKMHFLSLHQCPSYQSILLTKGPIHEIFMKKYQVLPKLENEFFLVSHFEFFCCCFFLMKTTLAFIRGIIFFCNMDGFFRILEKTSSELIVMFYKPFRFF